MSTIDPNAILRGLQLTLVGAYRALQNPSLFESQHYRQAALAVALGLALRIIIGIPVWILRGTLYTASFMITTNPHWVNNVVSSLDFLERYVLQLPFFLMALMQYITPTLDELFMKSLAWVDQTYLAKHKDDNHPLRPLYSPSLQQYTAHHERLDKTSALKKQTKSSFVIFLQRYARKAGISLAVYICSFVPYLGPLVLPAASFYSFRGAVGVVPAAIIFAIGAFLPKRWMVVGLQSYFASRGLMRELLEPYFKRVKYTPEQKRLWFRDREGLLFGFAIGWYLLIKTPYFGILLYGIAEAATAFLVTKITDPPPPPSSPEAKDFAQSQIVWKNKHEFVALPIDKIDRLEELVHQLPEKAKEKIQRLDGEREGRAQEKLQDMEEKRVY
ncbi:hypothetical protein BJ508DRAFT_411394 [Ascobolus immersus RN42]|uniref:Transmembrane protein UsgS n=1 Tax=Ascobolus immersus RN42 TaxID=1160509 RepID=A0A3N4IPT3_ASCIM|nr:hypothetical protein BJ508DRAFT_411394 [Ascobolus immersus RN42]